MADQATIDAAIRTHQNTILALAEGFKSVISSASGALRLLSTVNAGGVIALLGFIGATAGKAPPIFSSSEPFVLPMTIFGIGLSLSVVAACGMYFTQLFFSTSANKMEFNFEHPFVHPTTSSKRCKIAGTTFQILTILFATASFCLFLIGLYYCRDLVLSARFS